MNRAIVCVSWPLPNPWEVLQVSVTQLSVLLETTWCVCECEPISWLRRRRRRRRRKRREKMEGNRDEAERCLNIATTALEAGDKEQAVKFLNKAQRLFPTDRAKGTELAPACRVRAPGVSTQLTSVSRTGSAPTRTAAVRCVTVTQYVFTCQHEVLMNCGVETGNGATHRAQWEASGVVLANLAKALLSVHRHYERRMSVNLSIRGFDSDAQQSFFTARGQKELPTLASDQVVAVLTLAAACVSILKSGWPLTSLHFNLLVPGNGAVERPGSVYRWGQSRPVEPGGGCRMRGGGADQQSQVPIFKLNDPERASMWWVNPGLSDVWGGTHKRLFNIQYGVLLWDRWMLYWSRGKCRHPVSHNTVKHKSIGILKGCILLFLYTPSPKLLMCCLLPL